MGDLGFLTERPVAHRGLHDAARGIVENTAGAVDAALGAGYAIEVDLQLAADGVPMVFHDATLDRLTTAAGPLAHRTSAELQAVRFTATADPMMRLDDLLARVAGRVPLVIELKSLQGSGAALAACAAARLARYDGPAALMSFDPQLLPIVRAHAPRVPRGIVAQRRFDHAEWASLSRRERWIMGHLAHWPWSRFQFVAYRVADLDSPAPRLARALGLPLLTWTVRSPTDRARAARFADQIIFEGFRP